MFIALYSRSFTSLAACPSDVSPFPCESPRLPQVEHHPSIIAPLKHPCIQTLDALYCAGAEVSLCTTNEHYSPPHILTLSAYLSVEDEEHALSLYHFTVHLIRDLPLLGGDKNDETCIHTCTLADDFPEL